MTFFCVAEVRLCTHTNAGMFWHVPRQIIKSSAASNNTIMFMCSVFIVADTSSKELQVEPLTGLTPHAVCVFAQTGCAD